VDVNGRRMTNNGGHNYSQRKVVRAPTVKPPGGGSPSLWLGPVSTVDGGMLGTEKDVTIVGGAITVTRPGIYSVDTEGAAASDELTTINGGGNGYEIILKCASNARMIKIAPGGNILTGSTFRLNHVADRWRGLKNSAGDYAEIDRSSNG